MGIKILGDIKAGFEDAKSVPEIAEYIDSLDKLRSGARSQRTVIGVVGSTGAGKSSVINAVLDEECLVPTNCMRACTAVITELAYNSSVREDEKYRAEIHFVSTDEWARELLTMLDDMNAGQLSPGTQSTDSDASIAYQKVRSVYPSLSSDEIKSGEVTAEGLAQDPSVKEVLGTVKQIASSTSTEFLDFLKKFIDSKEKTRGKKKEPDAMEYWPLIKVVKVFVKSPVLQSGLVLVDLVSRPPVSHTTQVLIGGVAWGTGFKRGPVCRRVKLHRAVLWTLGGGTRHSCGRRQGRPDTPRHRF